MTTVGDVAAELDTSVSEVLGACRSLGIVASSAASGLSAAEHQRLRADLHAAVDLPPIHAGSTDPDPSAPVPVDERSLRARHDDLRNQRRRSRISTRTLTRIGIYSFLVVAVVVAVVSLRDRADDAAGRELQRFSAADEGTCMDVVEGGNGSPLSPVACEVAHDAELYAVGTVGATDPTIEPGTDASYPGSEVLVAEAEQVCTERFTDYVGQPYAASSLDVALLVPTPGTWSLGDRDILCLIEDPDGPMVGSVAGTSR